MYVNSEGLYNNLQLKRDIPVGRYKPYTYTNKDFEDSKNKVPVFLIRNLDSKPIRLVDCTLRIEDQSYDITGLKLKDVFSILDYHGINNQLIEGFQVFEEIPAVWLSNFNTDNFIQIDGIESPLDLSEHYHANSSVLNKMDTMISLNIYDLNTDKAVPYVLQDDYIFYEVGPMVKVIMRVSSQEFYVYIDYDSKMSKHASVGDLIGKGDK